VRRVIVAGPARRDLGQIGHWTEQQFGQRRADTYASRLAILFKRIAEASEGWTSRAEPAFGEAVRSVSLRTVFPRGRHRVYYDFDAVSVRILRVLHLASALAAPTGD
jgi:plasmid stabilization system protein ParE